MSTPQSSCSLWSVKLQKLVDCTEAAETYDLLRTGVAEDGKVQLERRSYSCGAGLVWYECGLSYVVIVGCCVRIVCLRRTWLDGKCPSMRLIHSIRAYCCVLYPLICAHVYLRMCPWTRLVMLVFKLRMYACLHLTQMSIHACICACALGCASLCMYACYVHKHAFISHKCSSRPPSPLTQHL